MGWSIVRIDDKVRVAYPYDGKQYPPRKFLEGDTDITIMTGFFKIKG